MSEPVRVLVVDDDALVSAMIQDQLETLGYTVVGEAANGRQAISMAQELRPDVILMDIRMPEMGGIEAAQRIQECCPTPVVILTAFESPELVRDASKAGVGAYLVKPANMRELERAITIARARFDDLMELRRLNAALEQEIAERKRVEASLRESESRYRAVAETAVDAIITVNNDGQIVSWNRGAQNIFGYRAEEVLNQNLDMLLPVRCRGSHHRGMDELRATGKCHIAGGMVEVQGLRKDGTEFPMELSLASWQAGGETFYTAIIRDIAERKEAEAELRKLTLAVEQSANSIIITDLEGRIEYVNPKFVETTGYTLEEVRGQTPGILKSGDQDDEFYEDLWTTIRAGCEWHGEFHNKRKDGTFFWEQATIAPVYDPDGKMTHFIAIKEDITARKEAEEALQQERNLLRTLIDTLPDLILVKDLQGRFILVNKALARIAGASSPEEMIGKTEFDYVPREIASEFWELEQEILRTGEPIINRMEQSITPSGEVKWILTSKVPFYDSQGEIAGVVGIARDVTALKEAEEQLRRYAQQLEEQNAELDAFAHTVAHDLKNPVNVFLGYASMLEKEWESISPDTRQKFLHILVQQGHKMNTIINELLLLASVREVEEVDRRPLDMEVIVDEALSQLHYLIKEFQAEVILPERWPQAVGHAPWVEAMWVNYISNAIKYGGRPPRVELGADVVQGEGETPATVRFWVRDNGPGLSPEEQNRLFTPFERLHKARAEGHGLGLCIVQRIAGKLGGQVGVESEPGQGSTFYFVLPAA